MVCDRHRGPRRVRLVPLCPTWDHFQLDATPLGSAPASGEQETIFSPQLLEAVLYTIFLVLLFNAFRAYETNIDVFGFGTHEEIKAFLDWYRKKDDLKRVIVPFVLLYGLYIVLYRYAKGREDPQGLQLPQADTNYREGEVR